MGDENSTVTDIDVGGSTGGETSSVETKSDVNKNVQSGKQIDDPDGENFDYDAWKAAQGIKSASEKDDEKSTKKDDKKTDKKEDQKDDKKADQNSKEDKSEKDEPKTPEIEIKLKVNGEERTVKDIQEITRLAQLGAASNEKFQEAAETRKQVQDLFKTLQTDPAKVFRHETLGKVFKEAAEKYLYEEYMLESMPADQRELHMAKRERDQMQAEQQERQRQEQEQFEQAQRDHWKQKFTDDINETLKVGNLPNNQWTVKRTAMLLQQLINAGQTATPQQLAEKVRADLMEEHKTLIAQTDDPEKLIEIIGKDAVDKIRKHNLSKLKDSDTKPKITNNNDRSSNQMNQRKIYRSASEMMDDIRG